MQIRVDKLRANLALLHPVVPKKPTLPVIANVLVKDGRMAATDLENTVTVAVPEAREELLLPYRSVMRTSEVCPRR